MARNQGGEAQHAFTGAPAQATALYVSYDGLLEPLGESQVVPYLEGLAARYRIIVLSFEKQEDLAETKRLCAMSERLTASGVRWVRLRYHKHPAVLSTAWDVARGIWRGWRCMGEEPVQLVHARGYVAALIAIALKRLTGAAFLFDMRGFWADEKVDAGHWRAGSWLHRLAKRCERMFVESADAIVSLTHAGVHALLQLGYRLRPSAPVRVVTTCTDLDRFTPGPKDDALAAWLGLDNHCVIGTTGTMSNWYLRRDMLQALAYLAGALPFAKVLLVTREPHEALRVEAEAVGLSGDRLVIARAPFSEMPAYLKLMDVGLFFIKPCFSKQGSAATKLGEFLATGVPVVINDGVGDSGGFIRDAGAGVVLPGPELPNVQAALPAIRALLEDAGVRTRCRRAAERYFSLTDGVRAYDELYERLFNKEAPIAMAVAESSCR